MTALESPVDIRPADLEIVRAILREGLPPGAKVWVFGSRATWATKDSSDLDLAIDAGRKLSLAELSGLNSAFEESDLPYRVDLVDWATTSETFRKIIEQDRVAFPQLDRNLEDAPWSSVILEDVAEEITVGHVGSMSSQYVDAGIPFLRSLNVEPFKIALNDLKFIAHGFHEKLRKSVLHPGDVVIVRTGKPGSCAVIPSWLQEANCSDLVIVRCGPRLNPWFLCYFMNSVAVDHINAHLVGAVQQHFNVGAARKLRMGLPLRNEQDRIASVLGALDSKIELNRRMNETLEAMAGTIFKDWFVDFGPTRAKAEGRTPYLSLDLWSLFPDRLDDEGKPKGWEMLRLESLVEHCKGSVSPKDEPSRIFEHYSLPAFDNGQEPSMDLGEKILSNKTVVPEGSVLLSKLNPEISRVWLPKRLTNFPQVASTEFLVFKPKPHVGKGFLYCLLRQVRFKKMLECMVTGTSKSHQRISPPALLLTEVLCGSTVAFRSFELVLSPILDRLLANRNETSDLAKLRDLLLPKLMSGEIRLRDAERAVEAVL
jgi:type I restriction enzyme S subunit